MLKDTSLVKDLFSHKHEIHRLQWELKDKIIPDIIKTCLDNKELQYIGLNYAKLHKDFVGQRSRI